MIPAQVKVVEHKKAVYVCKNCDKTGTEGTFIAAEAPKPLIEKKPCIRKYAFGNNKSEILHGSTFVPS